MKATYRITLLELGVALARHLVQRGDVASLSSIEAIQLGVLRFDPEGQSDQEVLDVTVSLSEPKDPS